MSDQAIRDVLLHHMPGATVLFVAKDGHRMALAVTGPAAEVIAGYQRAGYAVEVHSALTAVAGAGQASRAVSR